MNISPLAAGRKTRTIVFSFDEKYAKYFSAALVSLAAHADREYLYDIVVMHDSLSDRTIEKLKEIVTEGFSLRFFDVSAAAAEFLGDLPEHLITPPWNIATFYDLLVPLLMPEYERVLYCDSDIVFCSDPGELFEMPFEGRSLIAVHDPFPYILSVLPKDIFLLKQKDIALNVLGLPSVEDYFNSGVILFNISAVDKDVYLEKVRYALTFPELPTVDQDILNHVFARNVKWADTRFNLQTFLIPFLKDGIDDEKKEEYLDAARDPVIIHFSSPKKPWKYPDMHLSEHFWENAGKSPFFFRIFKDYITNACRAKNPGQRKYLLANVPYILSFRKGFGFINTIWEKTRGLRRRLLRKQVLWIMIPVMIILAGLIIGSRITASHDDPPRTAAGNSAAAGAEINGQSISFSHESGITEQDKLTVTLSAPEGCTVAFTTDGRLPTAEDDSGLQEIKVELGDRGTGYLIEHRDLMVYPEFAKSFLLDDPSLPSGVVLRAAAVSSSGVLGEPETKIFFPGLNFADLYPQCLIVSVIIDPEDLLDHEKGILASGAVYDSWKQTTDARESIAQNEIWEVQSNSSGKGRSWERPCTVQIFDGGSAPAVEQNAGIRITGHASRVANQKSFNLFFRDEYGSKYLEYELFEGISRYKGFRLRGGGNNTEWLKFKDSFLMELVKDRNFTIASSRPAILFLNGEYWGPYLLTEKLSAQMLRDHCGVDKDLVVMIKEGELEEGSEEDLLLFEELMSYAEKDLTDPDVWLKFCGIMDIHSMADYCAARIYFGDADWKPDKNDVLWRTRDQSYNEGRWQYILYDVEYSSGMYGSELTAAETDHFSLAREYHPLFAAALRNPEFYSLFLQDLREIGSENCNIDRVEKIMNDYLDIWEPLMPDYYKRFGDTRSQWEYSLKSTLSFFRVRYANLLPGAENFEK